MRLVLFCLTVLVVAVFSADEPGCVYLDKYNFNLLVDGSKHTLVRFDTDWPSGYQADQFKDLAKRYSALKEIPTNFVLASVKKGYGDNDNQKLLDRWVIVGCTRACPCVFVDDDVGYRKHRFSSVSIIFERCKRCRSESFQREELYR